MLQNPTKQVEKTRDLLANEYGVPHSNNKRQRGAGAKYAGNKKSIILAKPNKRLPRENRINAAAPLPPLGAQDFEKVLH